MLLDLPPPSSGMALCQPPPSPPGSSSRPQPPHFLLVELTTSPALRTITPLHLPPSSHSQVSQRHVGTCACIIWPCPLAQHALHGNGSICYLPADSQLALHRLAVECWGRVLLPVRAEWYQVLCETLCDSKRPWEGCGPPELSIWLEDALQDAGMLESGGL